MSTGLLQGFIVKTAYVIRTRTCFGSGAVARAGWAKRLCASGQGSLTDCVMGFGPSQPRLDPHENTFLPGEGIA